MDDTNKGLIAWFARNSVAANLLMVFIISACKEPEKKTDGSKEMIWKTSKALRKKQKEFDSRCKERN